MKSLGLVFASAIVFVGASAGAWWAKGQLQPPSSAVASAMRETSMSGIDSLPAPSLDDQKMTETDNLPVAVRPKEVSVEEMLRLGMSLNERKMRISEEEEKLNQREIQQQIALDDIASEREEIDQLRSEVQSQLASAEQMVTRLIQARQAVIDERAATEKTLKKMQDAQLDFDADQAEKTKTLGQWIQDMSPEKGAELLQEMANDGNLKIAAEILSYIEEREAAQLLSSIEDAKLVQDIVSEFRNLQTKKNSTDRNNFRR